MPRYKPSDLMFEISAEAAAKAMIGKSLTLEDVRCVRPYPPTCRRNGVSILDPRGKDFVHADLYWDDLTERWLLALSPEQYDKFKRATRGPHDTLGAVVV